MSLAELLFANASAVRHQDKVYGVVTGIVRDIKDPRQQGRVKVDFPWLAGDADAVAITSDTEEDRAHSYWARIATLMAGKGRGTWFIPEVGDEVLVAFEHGVLDRPVVLGVLWNDDDRPREKMDREGKNDVRVIRSRSGHEIRLNDSDDKPSILIVDKTGENSILIDSAKNAMEIKVKGDLSIDVGGNVSLKARGKIEVDATQEIAAQTQTNLEVKATGNATLESTGPMEVKSSAKLTLNGTGQAEVKAAVVSVNGSGLTEVKGGLVKIN